MVIKFDPTNKPDFVTQDYLIDDKSTGEQVVGYLLQSSNGEERISANDYIIVSNGLRKLIKRSDYLANQQLRRIVTQEVAIQLLEDMLQAVQDLAVTDAVKLDLLKTVDVVLIMIVGNKIVAARAICNAIPTTANFTAARKNALLNMIDNAITTL